MYGRRNAHESEDIPDRDNACAGREHGPGAMGGDRSRKSGPKYHQHVGQHRPYLQDGGQYGRQFCGDGKDLRAGQEVLRPVKGGEQPDTGRPQGA